MTGGTDIGTSCPRSPVLLHLCRGETTLRGVSRLLGHAALQGAVLSPQPAWELLYLHPCAGGCALAWG